MTIQMDPIKTDVHAKPAQPTDLPSVSLPTTSAKKPKKTPQKSAKKARHTPAWHADFEPESKGWRNIWWLLWWSYGFCRLYKFEWIRIPHHWGSREARVRQNSHDMWLMGPRSFATYIYRSIKGGVGKTTSSTWVGGEVALRTTVATLIADFDRGSQGKAAHRLDIDIKKEQYDTLAVVDLVLKSRTTLTHKELLMMLPAHKETGAVILAPRDELELSAYKTERLLVALNPAFGVMFIDTTPGVGEHNTVGVQRYATITVIPTKFGSRDLHHDIRSIRDKMNNSDTSGLYDNLAEEGRLFVEINGVPKADFNRRTQYEYAQQLSLRPEQVILMPYDQHIASDGAVRRASVSKRYLYAVSEQARTLTGAAVQYNMDHPWDGPTASVKEDVQKQSNRVADQLLELHDGDASSAAKMVLDRAQTS